MTAWTLQGLGKIWGRIISPDTTGATKLLLLWYLLPMLVYGWSSHPVGNVLPHLLCWLKKLQIIRTRKICFIDFTFQKLNQFSIHISCCHNRRRRSGNYYWNLLFDRFNSRLRLFIGVFYEHPTKKTIFCHCFIYFDSFQV